MRDRVRRKIVALAVSASGLSLACGGTERRPNVPLGGKAQELRHSAGETAQDCGEAVESKTDETCRVHPVGECLDAALKVCRKAYGMRSFFTDEGDAIRIDWLVLPDAEGGCNLVVVEDRSADPLAKNTPSLQKCESIGWKAHERIKGCEAPVPQTCKLVDAPPKSEES